MKVVVLDSAPLWLLTQTRPDPIAAACRQWVTPTMKRAAELWALARQIGRPTAGDNTIDADMILVAQAESVGDPNTIIATTNVGHLAHFFAADLWTNITP